MAEKIRVMIPEEEVDAKIAELGKKISEDFAGETVHLMCILKGSAFFVCELAKRITVPVTIDFMQVSSYGAETKSSGVVKLSKDLDEPLQGKNVIIVEGRASVSYNEAKIVASSIKLAEFSEKEDDFNEKIISSIGIIVG